VRFLDFPLPWEDDLSMSPNDREWVDSVSGVLESIDLSGVEEILALASTQAKPNRKASLAKSLIKWGFFGPSAATPPTVVVDVRPDPACELIHWGSLSVGVTNLDRSLSQSVSSTSVLSKSQWGTFGG
jgi:hypothetical protein